VQTPFIVAEIGASHNGSLDRAISIMEAAARAGAHAVKGQCWEPGLMVGDWTYVIPEGPWAGRRLADLYDEARMPLDWHVALMARAKDLGIEYFATAFDIPSVEFLECLGVKRHKIASFELVDLRLIDYAARKGKPLILSTGMASQTEIVEAVRVAKEHVPHLTILNCVSAYPAAPEDIDLTWSRHEIGRDIRARHYSSSVGLSDHSQGIGVAVAAVALGAKYIEKHLTLSRSDGGPDAAFSMEPNEFAQLVQECQRVSTAITADHHLRPAAEKPQLALRRSLFFAHARRAGYVLQASDVRSARPALGLAPKHLSEIVGQSLVRDVKGGEPVSWDSLCITTAP
jgi:N-acetylneuraminate synthase